MFNRIRIKANRQTLANNIQDKLFEDISQLATLCVNLETDVLVSLPMCLAAHVPDSAP